ncbi:hypothetical protein AB833_26835 [Chromatiales bacterium (ex Bugula neritina AB1)]|nr:hypothetical protein AB833_26835 [Chromatiales bacterium (ex Bugula neritina AB1)]
MRWQQGRKSRNIEDRRGGRGGGTVARRGGSKMGGLMTIGLVIAGLVFGVNPMKLINMTGGLGGLGGGGASIGAPAGGGVQYDASARKDDQAGQFVASVLGYTEDTWNDIFRSYGAKYQPPTLVMFEGSVRSACGTQSSAAGPFYCPGDKQVYIDTSFFRELQNMGAPGDFAMAYVIGHEVAHHVQNLEGISMKVQGRQRRVSKVEANRLSVLTELQADCYAGVWAHHTQKKTRFLEEGDLEEGLNAAAQIGDDVLLKKAGHTPHESMYTHGSAKQRQQWFTEGLRNGKVENCNTFRQAGVQL